MKFKDGDTLICVDDKDSANHLIVGNSYVAKKDSFMYNNEEYISLKNVAGSMFYASRFINIKEERKLKLKKLNHENGM